MAHADFAGERVELGSDTWLTLTTQDSQLKTDRDIEREALG
jgi:hypothetical protein